MRRDDVLAILGTFILAVMAWLDPGWRWFWAIAAIVMLLWSLHSAFFGDDASRPKL
jgi:hypothetical protein